MTQSRLSHDGSFVPLQHFRTRRTPGSPL